MTRESSPSPDPPPDDPIDDVVGDTLSLLGRAHAPELLYIFARDPGPWRFGQIQSALDISSNTLTERLSELVAAGMLDRDQFEEIPPRVEYTATERATALKPVFTELYRWASEWGLDESQNV